MGDLLHWDIYELHSETTRLHGVCCRRKIRTLAKDNQITIIPENAIDKENVVRLAFLHQQDISLVKNFIEKEFPNSTLTKVIDKIANPVLSSITVNYPLKK